MRAFRFFEPIGVRCLPGGVPSRTTWIAASTRIPPWPSAPPSWRSEQTLAPRIPPGKRLGAPQASPRAGQGENQRRLCLSRVSPFRHPGPCPPPGCRNRGAQDQVLVLPVVARQCSGADPSPSRDPTPPPAGSASGARQTRRQGAKGGRIRRASRDVTVALDNSVKGSVAIVSAGRDGTGHVVSELELDRFKSPFNLAQVHFESGLGEGWVDGGLFHSDPLLSDRDGVLGGHVGGSSGRSSAM